MTTNLVDNMADKILESASVDGSLDLITFRIAIITLAAWALDQMVHDNQPAPSEIELLSVKLTEVASGFRAHFDVPSRVM